MFLKLIKFLKKIIKQNQENARSCNCVLGYQFCLFPRIISIGFWNFSDIILFCFIHLITFYKFSNSININITNNYLSAQIIEHEKDQDIRRYESDPGLGQLHTCGWFKPINGIQRFPLDTNIKHVQTRSHSNRRHT